MRWKGGPPPELQRATEGANRNPTDFNWNVRNKEHEEQQHENSDGADIARSTRQHRPQDRHLARRIRSPLLCFQRRWYRADPRVTEGRTTTGRSEERRAGKSDAGHGALQAGRCRTKGVLTDGHACRYESGRL